MKFNKKNTLYFAWIVSLIGSFMSLYFSEIMNFTPCVLCWYQRIALYPLVFIIPIGIIGKDKNLPLHVLPLSISGLIIAFFHNLLYYDVVSEGIVPCIEGISCTTKFIEIFGFITIPLLSFLAFAMIILCMIIYIKTYK